MINRCKLFTVLLALLSLQVTGQTEYPVTWEVIKDVDINANTISKTPLSKGFALASSSQVLFAKGEANVFSGYLSFTHTDNSGGGNNTEVKTIGYAPINDPLVGPNDITYGFSFSKNHKLKMYSPEGAVNIIYSGNPVIKLERNNNVMHYYMNGTEVYSVIVSVSESLEIRAKLISDDALFSNVVTNYNTTPFCVTPIIDNVTKTIELQITGGFPPYSYVWDSGDGCRTGCGGRSVTTFVEGSNYVTIKDAQGNRIQKMYSFGSDAVWANFYQTTQTGFILSKIVPDSKWGSATLNNSFASNSSSWAEYVIEEELNGDKAFGFADVSTTVRKTQDLKAGFLISKGNLQVIDNGAIVLSTIYSCKDALHIDYTFGKVTWYQSGKEIYRSTYAMNGDITVAGLVRNDGTINHLNYSTNQPSLVNAVWDEITETGQINVDINSIVGVTGPFHYLISNEMIPHLDEVYAYLKDSLQLPVDSIEFYTGKTAATTYSFTDLESGTYHVSVFDSQGNRLFAKEIHVQGDFTFDTQTNIVASGLSITAVGGDGIGDLELYTYEGLNSELTVDLVNVKGDMFIGFSEIPTVVTGYQDLVYGFYLSNRKLYTVQNGVLSTNYTILRQNEELFLKVSEGELKLSTTNEEMLALELPLEYAHKVALGLGQGSEIILKKPSKPLVSKKPWFSFKGGHATCDGGFGYFGFSVHYPSIVPMSYEVLDEVQNSVQINSSASTNTSYPITNLPAGIYTVNYYVNGVGSFTSQVFVGYEVVWELNPGYNLTPNNHSVLVENPSISSYASSRSLNIMKYDDAGWIEFTPKINGSTPYVTNMFRFTTENLGLDPTAAGLGIFNEDWASFFYYAPLNIYEMQIFSSIQGYAMPAYISIPVNARVRIIFTNTPDPGNGAPYGWIEVYVNEQLKTTVPRSNNAVIARCNSNYDLNGFENVITSFSCRKSEDMYAHLKYDLDGYYHIMKEGKINFIFDQEYDTDDLTFNIYKLTDELVKTQANFSPLTTTNGANYLTINVSDDLHCIGKGFFYLEVINSKKEKMYLRFFNDFSNPTCSIYDTAPNVTE